MKPCFERKSVLVTGAGGSIGSQLCRLIVGDNASRLVMVSKTESGLYETRRRLEQEFRRYRDTEIVPILGSCGDMHLMKKLLAGVEVVIHAAAHKHLPLCELNQVSAIENNVIATWNLIRAANIAGVPQVVIVSSDKAVNPSSVMGATKRAVELIVAWFATVANPTKFTTVRFGNVADSAGSVMPLWREQIEAGGPLTITDKRCERYFMSITSAVSLIASVIQMAPASGTFVLEMGRPVKMIDIANRMIASAGKTGAIEILETGLRPGEKLTEELHYGGELEDTAVEGVLRVVEPPRAMQDLGHDLAQLAQHCRLHNTEAALAWLWKLVTESRAVSSDVG